MVFISPAPLHVCVCMCTTDIPFEREFWFSSLLEKTFSLKMPSFPQCWASGSELMNFSLLPIRTFTQRHISNRLALYVSGI